MTLTAGAFTTISQVVRDEAGIVLEKGKEYLVESRLVPVCKKAGIADLDQLAAALRRKTDRNLLLDVIDAMTTNETSFFRDRHPFESLKNEIIPQLRKSRSDKTLRIWCGAASSGQEPYTIAITLLEALPDADSWKIEFLATDICRDVLEKARKGKYSQLEVNRGMPANLLVKYFDRRGTRYILKEKVRRMVTFKELNLLRPLPPMGKLDIVFLRNVLIYFDNPTKADILGRIHRLLKPDGLLFLGSTETLLSLKLPYSRQTAGRAVCYRPKSGS